ncbi:hypothetical protein JRO89_XS02G0069300 [Xanthoceras sorbifolium]|uniref:DYW domain-containing protein n=1 Tax=Xanthoceras sorbifolium TaxID=99658 RepID=A0ABQ8IFB0_9ROSI|nr:hypothetical protein JRO89_XS02G0069300 [Xanthoceras sorbifolium]
MLLGCIEYELLCASVRIIFFNSSSSGMQILSLKYTIPSFLTALSGFNYHISDNSIHEFSAIFILDSDSFSSTGAILRSLPCDVFFHSVHIVLGLSSCGLVNYLFILSNLSIQTSIMRQMHPHLVCFYRLHRDQPSRCLYYFPAIQNHNNIVSPKSTFMFRDRRISKFFPLLQLGSPFIFIATKLVNHYANLGDVSFSRYTFDHISNKNVYTWNSMVSAYVRSGRFHEAVDCFYQVLLTSGVSMDPVTVASILPVCAQLDDIVCGMLIHLYVIKHGLEFDLFVSNALINVYAKFGILEHALRVFDKMVVRDIVSWNSIIAAYEQNNDPIHAYGFFNKMQQVRIQPDSLTLVSLASILGVLGALRQGMKIHGQVIKDGLYLDVFVGTSLIDLYGKCGRLDDAMLLFYQMPRKTSVPWNAIISCHGVHGHADKALNLFREMLDEGVKPDDITFVSLLSACSHSGLVSEGQRCFHLMQGECGIKPHLKHYGCMVDLYGRAGQLGMAYKFIINMPIRPDASVWGALLGACRIHGNVELGAYASDRLFEVDSENVGYYVLMSNMYANVGKWEGVDKVRSLARDRGLKKTPGWSSTEVNNKVEVFYTGNQTHPKCEEIYQELRILTAKMKTLGYVPDHSFVLQDVEDDEKEHILTSHSERLAIAFAIISTPPKSPIRIFKNLRVCGDCHNATKFISRITEREIIVRDSNRFHHFKDGICSCGDYW